MVVYEKINFEPYINNQYIWHKNNTAQLYFIMVAATQQVSFSRHLENILERNSSLSTRQCVSLPLIHPAWGEMLFQNKSNCWVEYFCIYHFLFTMRPIMKRLSSYTQISCDALLLKLLLVVLQWKLILKNKFVSCGKKKIAQIGRIMITRTLDALILRVATETAIDTNL